MIYLNERHQYIDDAEPDAQYIGVTGLIRQLGLRKSFAGVDEDTLKFAALRGEAVESILYALIQGHEASVDVPAWERGGKTLRETVEARIPGIQNFLADHQPEYVAHQMIVSDREALVAGTLDLVCEIKGERWVLDCKATSKAEDDWIYQASSYAGMLAMMKPESVVASVTEMRVGVLHFRPEWKSGYRVHEYADAPDKWERLRAARITSLDAYRRVTA